MAKFECTISLDSLDTTQASLLNTIMTQHWQPGTDYHHGDVVTFEGHQYKIIQPHRSQGDWAPTVTPALWGRLSDDQCAPQCAPPHCATPPQQHYNQPPLAQTDEKYSQNQGYQPQPQPQHERPDDKKGEKKHWYDVDDDAKKALGIAGGIAGGAALLGAGFAAFKHHEHKKDEKEWLQEAEARAEQFRRQGPSGPATWVLNHGKTIPPNAIEVGKENSWTLYVARGYYKGSITPGKASDVFKKGAVIGYAHDEIHLETYEILVGDMRGLKWVPASGKLSIAALGARPVEGGVDSDGTPLFVARASHKGCWHPGKISEELKAAFIPYGGGEEEVKSYEVLCYY